MEQRTDEWRLARCGSLGASQVGKAIKFLKSGGRFAEAIDLQYELAAERITGHPARQVNARDWGNQCEAQARTDYALGTNLPVRQEGLIPHPTIPNAHASPDGLVGDVGGLEIKCPTSGRHLRTLLENAVPEDNLSQIHWNLACSKRLWWDFVSYDPRFPSEMQMLVIKVERDFRIIEAMEAEVRTWLAEVDNLVRRAQGP